MKDQHIQQLFDNYANELPQQSNLAENARTKMTGRKKACRKRRTFFARLGAICCALIVCVLCLSVVTRVLSGNRNDNAAPSAPEQSLKTYAVSDLRGMRLTGGDEAGTIGSVRTMFAIDEVESLFGEVVNATYTAYYSSDGLLTCISAAYRVRYSDRLVDVTVIGEINGFVNEQLYGEYRYFSDNNAGFIHGETDGEAVCRTFVENAKVHFYVTAFNSDNNVSYNVCRNIAAVL